MIVKFKDIQHDYYGKVEQPVLVLKTRDGRNITTINNYFGLTATFRYNDVSEISFTVPAYTDGVKNNGYEEIVGLRLVNVEPYGDFILINPEKSGDGVRESKTCTAYSLEYVFNDKKLEIPAGTYNFYNAFDNSNTITAMILELVPDWKLGSIDREFNGKWRTFDNVNENLYSFMMGTLQETYNCLFLFDTKTKTIHIKSVNSSPSRLPIYLSYNNLIKDITITELSEEVVTALSGYGSGDDVNIFPVNPNGSNTIYNLDYFISQGDLPEEITKRWLLYKTTFDLNQQVFSNLTVLYNQKLQEFNLADARLDFLQTEYDAINETYLTAKTQQGTNEKYDEQGIAELKKQLDDKDVEVVAQKMVLYGNGKNDTGLEGELKQISEQRVGVIDTCKLSSFFTPDELKILTQYFKYDSISEDTFVIPEYSASVLGSENNVLGNRSNASIKVQGAEITATNIAEIFLPDENGVYQAFVPGEDNGEPMFNTNQGELFNDVNISKETAVTVANQLNDELCRNVYWMQGGNFEFKYTSEDSIDGKIVIKNNTISGDVVRIDFHHNTKNLVNYVDETSADITKAGHFMISATIRNATYNDTDYPLMNFSIEGMIFDKTPTIREDGLAFNIEKGVYIINASSSDYQKQSIVQELYDYTKDTLNKLAWPSYEFSVNSGNFVFAKQFEPYKDVLELGCEINLSLDDDYDNVLHPILIELQLDYDNEANFSLGFSNKFNSSNSEFKLADIIGKTVTTSNSISLNKANYTAYRDSKIADKVADMATAPFDLAKQAITNSRNQSVEMSSLGAFFREKQEDGSFSPEQVGIVKNCLAFTKDNWETTEIGIGKIFDENTGSGYGIAAPSIFGTLLAGKNLVISNTVLDENGQNIVKEFRVDETGAHLNNASFALSNDSDINTGADGGKILIDPQFGIAAGNSNLFGRDGHEIKPSFWDDEENKVIFDSKGMPLNSQFYFDINTGNAYFGGIINAEHIIAGTLNGYTIKEGTLDGSAIIDNTLNGSAIQRNTLDGSAISLGSLDSGTRLGGDINAEQLTTNVVNAINLSAKDAVIDQAHIGDLSADKITAGDISADRITTNVIKAIEGTFGNVEADTAFVKNLLTAGSILTEDMTSATVTGTSYIKGVKILGDLVVANTLRADALILKGKDGIYRKLNADALGEGVMEEYDNEYESTGKTPSVYDGLHGSVLIAESVTADRIDVTDLFAQTITARGSISGGVFLQGGRTIERVQATDNNGNLLYDEVGKPIYKTDTNGNYIYSNNGFSYIDNNGNKQYYTNGSYLGELGMSLGDSLIYDAETKELTVKGKISATALDLGNIAIEMDNISGLNDKFSDYAKTDALSVYIKKDGTLGTLPADNATDAGGNTGFNVSTNGLLRASNAVIYGTIYATNGKFTGTISANDGEIGGFTIKKDEYLANNTTSLAGSANSVFLSPEGISCGTSFKVTKEGKIYCYDDTKISTDDDPTAAETKLSIRTTGSTAVNVKQSNGTTVVKNYVNRVTNIAPNVIYMQLIDKNDSNENVCIGGRIYLDYNAEEAVDDNGTTQKSTKGAFFRFTRPIDVGYTGCLKGTAGHIKLMSLSDVLTDNKGTTSTSDDIKYQNIYFGPHRNYCYSTVRRSIVRGRDISLAAYGSSNETISYTWGDGKAKDYPLYKGTISVYGSFDRSIYLRNGTYIKGLKSGKENAIGGSDITNVDSTANQNIQANMIACVNSNDRVILGAAANSAPTEVRSPGNLLLRCDASTSDTQARTLHYFMNSSNKVYFYPGLSATANLGGDSHRWDNVYCVNCSESSDRNLKKDIKPLDEDYVRIFDLLKPVSYKYIHGTSNRIHTGFIAQEVEEAVAKVGLSSLDFAGYCKGDVTTHDENGNEVPVLDENGNQTYEYSLRYSEFIALNTAKIKQLEARYEDKIANLENKLDQALAVIEELKAAIA